MMNNTPKKFRLSTLLYNKKFTIALSIVLAFALWLGIAMTENPIRDRTFTDLSANITLEGTAAETLGLKIVSDVTTQKFAVTVTGPNYIVSSLKPEDFSLSASTIEVNDNGDYRLKLVAENKSNKSGFTISSISPATIDVSVDYMESKEFTVEPKLNGVTASDGLVVDTPIISDLQQGTIKIEGPRTKLNKIKSVAAVADVNSTLSSSETYKTDIILYDDNGEVLYRFTDGKKVYDAIGNEVTNSYLEPSFWTATVTQPISKKKVVKCKPVFENLPDGMTQKDIKYTISTSEITLVGAPENIDQVSEVTLSPINFKDISTTSNSFEVSAVNIPTGVRILENVESFIIDIDLTDYVEKSFYISSKNFKFTGLSNNLNAKTDKSIRIKICGPSDVVNQIQSKELTASFDLSNKTAGTYTVPAVLKSNVHKKIWQIGTAEAIITIY